MKTNAMTITNLQLFQILRGKFDEQEAENIVNYVDNKITTEFEDRKEIFATKEDIAHLAGKMDVLEAQLNIIKWAIPLPGIFVSIAVFQLIFIK